LVVVVATASLWLLDRPYAAVGEPLPRLIVPDRPDPVGLIATSAGSADAGRSRFVDADAGIPRAQPTIALSHVARLQNTFNVLLLGVDRHRGVIRGGRTDTIIVAAFSESDGHLGLISVPRDLYVEIPGEEPNRINAVWGLAKRARQNPLQAIERVIGDTLGLPIAHTIAIDLGVFETVVDAVGGVSVNIECAIQDSFIDARIDGGRRDLNLGSGRQELDGATAAMFVRSRHGRSDWSRARRQQLVLRSLHAQLASAEGLTMLPTVFGIVEDSIVSDMTRLELLALGRRVLRQDVRKVHGVVIGRREVTYHRTDRNWSVLLPEREAIVTKLEGLFKAPAPGTRATGGECLPADAALRGR
jgi:LCP family protein required for cell wall assembly